MSTLPHHVDSIRSALTDAADAGRRFLRTAAADVCLRDLVEATSLGGRAAEFAGRSVLVATRTQLAAALALVELDGLARRIVVCTPDLTPDHRAEIFAKAEVDEVVSEQDVRPLEPRTPSAGPRVETEWILLTSGTTGVPKMIVHTLASLTPVRSPEDGEVVWGTFYDIRRYGGLQILLRTLLGRGSFVMSDTGEATGAYLLRLGAAGATHVSGTPSHWRRVLMTPESRAIAPRYIRLSGEIADQGILNALHTAYPRAAVSHAFASTEAGLGFEVDDGLEGFPAHLVGGSGDVQLRVRDGSLRIRSSRNAAGRLADTSPLVDDEGFVDTGDAVERRGDRYYFLGRLSGTINVGGLKIHPEEVEATINRHPAVRMSMVRSKKSRITGALVTADVVLKREAGSGAHDDALTDLHREILALCREHLAPHKIPGILRFVSALDIAGAGKLARRA
ncbi:MAG TPA: AMP-binding protein [Vicinamibacterales bacterium]|nr:AMP-binding protein [Vicinamibacterales bacterium]